MYSLFRQRNTENEFKGFADTYKLPTLSMSIGMIFPNPATDKIRFIAIPVVFLSAAPFASFIFLDIFKEWMNNEMLEVIRHIAVTGPFMVGFIKMMLMYDKRVKGRKIIDTIDTDLAHYNTLPNKYQTMVRSYTRSTLKYHAVWCMCVMMILTAFVMTAFVSNIYTYLFTSEPKRYMIYDVGMPGKPFEYRLTSPYYEIITAYTLYISFVYVVNFTGYDSFMHAAINHACLKLMIFCNYVDDAMLMQGEELRRQMKMAIKAHIDTLRYIETVQETFGFYLAFMYGIVSMHMVVSLYLTNEGYTFDFQFTMFSVGTIVHLYVPCLVADKLKSTGEEAASRLYCCGWENVTDISVRKSARESYGDDAVGYVQLKRDGKICTVKCKVCPEHKVRSKHYTVSVLVDEEEEKVTTALCEDCPAAAGGCKHAIAFLFWLHRRSEEPACTSVECYWKKSNLSKVGSSLKVLTAKDMFKRKYQDPVPNASVLAEFVDECKKKKIETCQFLKHTENYIENRSLLSLHNLLYTYNDSDCKSFLTKIKGLFNDDNLNYAEMHTRNQYKSGLWFELRYGRITASKCYEVSRCKTFDGSLVALIFGGRTVQTPAIKRGQKLEDKVREVAEEKLGIKFTKCGLFICHEYPMIAGSPDGINRKKSLIEIKCPSTEKNFENYIKDGKLTKKCLAQVQIQMFCAKVNLTHFCVASSDFEQSKKVTILPITFNEEYVRKLIGHIVLFWELNIFPKLYESVNL